DLSCCKRTGNRTSLCVDGASESRCVARCGRCLFQRQTRTNCVACVTPCIPAIYEQRSFAAAGGLMRFRTNLAYRHLQTGVYTGRILKGEKPGDMPVVQASKFELVINLKTAKVLGLEVPLHLQQIADEVIE